MRIKKFPLPFLLFLISSLVVVACTRPSGDDDDSTAMDDDDTSGDDDDTSGDDDDSAAGDDDDSTQPIPSDDGDGAADDLIYEIQTGATAEGVFVDVQNVVITGVHQYGVFVQEPLSGAYSGVWVYTGADAGTFTTGQMVNVGGMTEEYAGSSGDWADTVTEINVGAYLPGAGDDDDSAEPGPTVNAYIEGSSATPATIVGQVLDVAVFTTADIERWEGVLVTVENVTVTVAPDNYGAWTVTGGVRVDDKLFTYNDPDGPSIGTSFASITGVLDYSWGEYKITPRDASDFVVP
ncbi:MAG: hypothetical protein CMP23_06830 [Rickettsiales bacterium]|nr:hypothetical protein [Rickettsiales bacterium]|tara:strand:+ start:6078 stop:6956 length:879 start_codon:yes stop_codon:yes gene_type:complete